VIIGWFVENLLHRIAAFLDDNAISDEFWDKDDDDIY
jgi:hypothetical protein